MKTLKKLITVVLVVQSYAFGISDAETAFLKKYEVSEDIKAILDKHSDEIAEKLDHVKRNHITEHTVWRFSWLPGYFVKFNLKRIYGMEKMKRSMERQNLNLLGVPDKRVYHVKGRPFAINNFNYVVVIKAVPRDPDAKPLSSAHIEQLLKLMKDTHYVSTTPTNFIRTYNDKLICIDTESTYNKQLYLSQGLRRFFVLLKHVESYYTKEALTMLIKEIAVNIAKKHGAEKQRLMYLFKGLISKRLTKNKENYSRSFNEFLNGSNS